MSTIPAGGSAFGSISNAPGKRDEDKLTNRAHTTKNVSGGTTTTTTITGTFADTATTVALNATVSAAKAAIVAARRADRIPSSNNANKTGRVRRIDA